MSEVKAGSVVVKLLYLEPVAIQVVGWSKLKYAHSSLKLPITVFHVVPSFADRTMTLPPKPPAIKIPSLARNANPPRRYGLLGILDPSSRVFTPVTY